MPRISEPMYLQSKAPSTPQASVEQAAKAALQELPALKEELRLGPWKDQDPTDAPMAHIETVGIGGTSMRMRVHKGADIAFCTSYRHGQLHGHINIYDKKDLT